MKLFLTFKPQYAELWRAGGKPIFILVLSIKMEVSDLFYAPAVVFPSKGPRCLLDTRCVYPRFDWAS
jgi:hypothetical protein